MNIFWADDAWADYLRWRSENQKVFKRINRLVETIDADPFRGIGKPEALRHDLTGYWSRRITEEHRLVYKVVGRKIYIISCRYHYK